jgi:4-hydroxythreonine-4-phosphate dehydrogenase
VQTARILITSGEPAGIGPDTCVSLAQSDWDCDLIVAGDAQLLASTAAALGLPLAIERYDTTLPRRLHKAGSLRVLHVPAKAPVVAGSLDPRNAAYVLSLLDRACDGCMNGEFGAMVTAPVQKSVIMDAGFAFSGHTEYLAHRCRAALPVMMLAGGGMRVALVTTHLPLSQVPAAITAERLTATLKIVSSELERLFDIKMPRLLLLGLNPHAGESGHLGREEIEVIEPVANALKRLGMQITGPVPADTAFNRTSLEGCDAVVAMYHDQGLPVLKYASFGEAVNITLGLPIIRVSVDHGTALALARTGKASDGSLRTALALAIDMLN